MTSVLCAECGVAWPEHGNTCYSSPVKQADMPLACRREGQQLVIRIGIDTLAFATEHCEKFYVEETHASSGPPYVKVVDKDEWFQNLVDKCAQIDNDYQHGGRNPAINHGRKSNTGLSRGFEH